MALRVALLGTGVIAAPHVTALRQLGDMVNLAAVCDRDGAKAEAFRQTWSIPTAYDDLNAMVAKERPDVIHVLLPPTAHAAMAIECLERGSHVFVEKPFCLSSEECRDVLRAAEINQRKVGVNHNLTYMPSLLKVIEEIKKWRLGEIQHTTVMYNLPMPALNGGQHGHWMFGDTGRIMFELGPHPLSVVHRLMGPVQSVATAVSGTRTLNNGKIFHETWQTSLVCQRGSAQCVLAMGGEYLNTWVHVVGQDGEAFADLRRNIVRLSEKTRYPRADSLLDAWRNSGSVMRQSLGNFIAQMKGTLGVGPAYEMQNFSMNSSVRAFYEALVAGKKLPVDGEDGAAVVKTCEAVVNSAAKFETEGAEQLVAR